MTANRHIQDLSRRINFGPQQQIWQCIIKAVISSALVVTGGSAYAASINQTQASSNSSVVWASVISLIVLAVSAASAALCAAAYRNWEQKLWRWGALLPLAILALMTANIISARLGSNGGHELWPLEVFAWAMANMIYMVGLMTTKRIFAKADAEKSLDGGN